MKRTKTKRFFSIVMAALMVLCMTATALATEPVAPTPIGTARIPQALPRT